MADNTYDANGPPACPGAPVGMPGQNLGGTAFSAGGPPATPGAPVGLPGPLPTPPSGPPGGTLPPPPAMPACPPTYDDSHHDPIATPAGHQYHFAVAIDKSGSMNLPEKEGGKVSRWHYAQEITYTLAEEMTGLDPDGITAYMFSSKKKKICHDGVTEDKVAELYANNVPGGPTYMSWVLDDFFAKYVDKRAKGLANRAILFVIHDGQPSDEEDVIQSICRFTHNGCLNGEEVGIFFVQVGHDEGADYFLTLLDNGLKEIYGAKFDIVETRKVAWVESHSISEAFHNAMHD